MDLLNHTASKSLQWRTPIEKAFGYTPDISPFMSFRFFEPVYYYEQDSFPETKEQLGYWLGVTRNCGDAFTYYVFKPSTQQVLARSVLRSALDSSGNIVSSSNVHLNHNNILPSKHDENNIDDSPLFTTKNDILDLEPTFDVASAYDSVSLDDLHLDTPSSPNDTNITDDEIAYNKDIDQSDDALSYNTFLDHVSLHYNDNSSKLFTFHGFKDHRMNNNRAEVLVLWDHGIPT